MRSVAVAFVSLWLFPVTACGQSADPGGSGTLGTIRATVDGEERTWYVVQGSSRGRPYSSAMWFETEGERLITVGGYDTDSPPLDTFEFDIASGEISFGDYRGSSMVLLVGVFEGSSTARIEIPSDRPFTVGYMPVVSDDMLTGTYMIATGAIEVIEASFDGNEASVRGAFRGTLEKMDGSGGVEVEDGRFEASGIPHRDELIEN